MCRIAGIVNKNITERELRGIVLNMCRILKNGGPDDEGIYSYPENHLVFGNRRLALLDLSNAGHQPMSYLDRYVITYNGELYNFPELKAELLRKGYKFYSSSDTEVILASFAEWGPDCFIKFNGMFAFALLDKQESTVYLVRDMSGIKPLYYYIGEDELVFASEIRAFNVIKSVQQEDPQWPVFMMAYGHLPEPITTLKDVKPLEKGTYIMYDLQSGKWKNKKYSSFVYSDSLTDKKNAIARIRVNLESAVKRHLLSDAAIGVFLSGGIDSSLIALLANHNIAELNTLSIYLNEAKYSEKRYQDIIQNKLQCNHHQYLLTEDEFHNHFASIINDMDLPSTDGINTWFISKFTREAGLKAVLSGLGGDELFGGYPSFKRMNIVHELEKMPNIFLKSLSKLNTKKIRRLCYLTLNNTKGKYLFLRGHFIPSEIAKNLNMDETQVWNILQEEEKVEINDLSLKNQASWIEMNLYMQNQLLRDSDVMSMAHGVEIRVPFLDKRFIELALQIKSDIKYAGKFPKQLLIDSFSDILPEPIWNRPKMGFSFPFNDWLKKNELVREMINSSGNFAKDTYKKFQEGSTHWSQLMNIVLLHKYAKA